MLECCTILYSSTDLFLVLILVEGTELPSHVGMARILKEPQGLNEISIFHVQSQATSDPFHGF